jgi:hypothetical protein
MNISFHLPSEYISEGADLSRVRRALISEALDPLINCKCENTLNFENSRDL